MTARYPGIHQTLLLVSSRLWHSRFAYLATILIPLLHRAPMLRLLLDGRLPSLAPRFAHVLKFTAVTSAVHVAGTHAVTGQTQPRVTPVAPSTNPAEATVGEPFAWVWSASIPGKRAMSYLVENLPPGITYDGRVQSNSFASITGVPSEAGDFVVEITAFEERNLRGDSAPVYELLINIEPGETALPPNITVGLQHQLVSVGDEIVLMVTAENGPFEYFWEKDGAPIPDAHEATLVLTDVTAETAGTYTVIVSNSQGEARSEAIVRVRTTDIPISPDRLLFSVTPEDAFLRALDATGTPTNAIPIVLEPALVGINVTGATSLSLDPISAKLYAILILSSPPEGQVGDRVLATLDPGTGVATLVGNPAADRLLNFVSLAFDNEGTLYGVTGDDPSSEDPETLFTLDKTTAEATFFMALGNGDAGEAIMFHLDENLLYHASGDIFDGQLQVLESIDLVGGGVEPINSEMGWKEAKALAYVGDGQFIVADEDTLYLVSSDGGVQIVAGTDHLPGGFAFVPALTDIDFEIARIEHGSEGALIAFPAEPGEDYTIEASNDLLSWEILMEDTVAEGVEEVTFLDESDAPFRYYRARRVRNLEQG